MDLQFSEQVIWSNKVIRHKNSIFFLLVGFFFKNCSVKGQNIWNITLLFGIHQVISGTENNIFMINHFLGSGNYTCPVTHFSLNKKRNHLNKQYSSTRCIALHNEQQMLSILSVFFLCCVKIQNCV